MPMTWPNPVILGVQHGAFPSDEPMEIKQTSTSSNTTEKKLMEYYTVFRLILINLLINEAQFDHMRDTYVKANPRSFTAAQINALLDTAEPTTEEFLVLMKVISPLTNNFLHREESKRYTPEAPDDAPSLLIPVKLAVYPAGHPQAGKLP